MNGSVHLYDLRTQRESCNSPRDELQNPAIHPGMNCRIYVIQNHYDRDAERTLERCVQSLSASAAKESAAQGSFESNKMRQCVFDTVDASVLEFYNKRIVADGVLKPAAVRNSGRGHSLSPTDLPIACFSSRTSGDYL